MIRVANGKALGGNLKVPEFDLNPKLKPGHELLAFGLLPAAYQSSLTFALGHLVKEISTPQHLFVVTGSLRMDWLAPICGKSGKVIGFLVPDPLYQRGGGGAVNIVLPVARLMELIERPKKKRERSWLGVSDMQAVTKDIAEVLGLPEGRGGVLIGRVLEGMPAWEGGLRVEDVITTLDGEDVVVRNDPELRAFIERVKGFGVGKVAKLNVFRNGQEVDLSIKLGERPKNEAKAKRYEEKEMGLILRELVYYDTLARDLKPGYAGLMVHYVKSGSWSELGGMRRGDIITKIGDEKLKGSGEVGIEQMKRILSELKAKKKREFVIFVSRGRRGQDSAFVRIETNWAK